MTFLELQRLVEGSLADQGEIYDRKILSDACFRAIRELQQETRCSKMRVRKQCPAASITISTSTKAAGIITITTSAAHNLDVGLSGTIALTAPNAEYDGVMTILAVPSTVTFTYKLGSSSPAAGGAGKLNLAAFYETRLNPTFQGSDFAAASTNTFNIECVNVDAVWSVGSLTSATALNPIFLYDTRTIQFAKDNMLILNSDSTTLTGTVDFDNQYVKLFSPIDLTGKLLEFWIRFQIPYIADAFVGSVTIGATSGVSIQNSLVETIPQKYQGNLEDGIKYYIYRMLEEKSGGKGAYAQLMSLFGARWLTKILPVVKQDSNEYIANETVSWVQPTQLFQPDVIT